MSLPPARKAAGRSVSISAQSTINGLNFSHSQHRLLLYLLCCLPICKVLATSNMRTLQEAAQLHCDKHNYSYTSVPKSRVHCSKTLSCCLLTLGLALRAASTKSLSSMGRILSAGTVLMADPSSLQQFTHIHQLHMFWRTPKTKSSQSLVHESYHSKRNMVYCTALNITIPALKWVLA